MIRKNNWYNYQQPTHERHTLPSKTIPDQAMSIREIMVKHTRGIPIETKMPTYHNDHELETLEGIDVRKLDITEIHTEMEKIAERLSKADQERKRLQDEDTKTKHAQAEQAKREQWKKEFEAELRSKESSTGQS